MSHDFLQCLHLVLASRCCEKETTSEEAVLQFTLYSLQQQTQTRNWLSPGIYPNLRLDRSLFRNKDGHYPWQTWILNLLNSGFFRGDLIIQMRSFELVESMIDNPMSGQRSRSHISMKYRPGPEHPELKSTVHVNALIFPSLDPAT